MRNEPNTADIRTKLAVVHYGLEFFHQLRTSKTRMSDWPWDFLVELIDDLECVETEMRPGLMAEIKAKPLTHEEQMTGLEMLLNRMNHALGSQIPKKITLNKFYSSVATRLRSERGAK